MSEAVELLSRLIRIDPSNPPSRDGRDNRSAGTYPLLAIPSSTSSGVTSNSVIVVSIQSPRRASASPTPERSSTIETDATTPSPPSSA